MNEREWWRDAVVYQLYVRSFGDANGDGAGDLGGIIERLDHLGDLGVDAVWLTPCYPSPQHDHGYDVADYFDIEPMYGTLDTFDELVSAAHGRGIRVLMDVVPNHCSDQHEWFQAALHAAPGSRERSRFWFRDGRGDRGELPPNNWRAVFGGSAWSRVVDRDGTPGQWYLHTFTPWQPDFDWNDPDVVDHFERMLTFWFDRGVDGFRIDAVTFVGKHPDLPDAPPPGDDLAETDVWAHNPYTLFWPSAHDIWRRWRTLVDDYERTHPGRQLVTVSEAYTARRPDLLLRYVQRDQFHQSFAFDLMLSPWVASMIRESIASVIDVLVPAGASLAWTLNNHDTQRAVTRYGRSDATSPESWTGNNLVYTDAPIDLELGTRRARAMVLFAAALPGTLYLYQGEELGLPEVLDIPDVRREDPVFVRTHGREIGRDGCRVPLPWTASATNAYGFSTRDVEPWLPQPDGWGSFAIGPEHDSATSMLTLYRRILETRKRLDPAAPLEWIDLDHDDVVAFRRGDVSIVLNVSSEPVALGAEIGGESDVVLASWVGDPFTGTLPGDAAILVRTRTS